MRCVLQEHWSRALLLGPLSHLGVSDVSGLFGMVIGLSSGAKGDGLKRLEKANLSGLVLELCDDLDAVKRELQVSSWG